MNTNTFENHHLRLWFEAHLSFQQKTSHAKVWQNQETKGSYAKATFWERQIHLNAINHQASVIQEDPSFCGFFLKFILMGSLVLNMSLITKNISELQNV